MTRLPDDPHDVPPSRLVEDLAALSPPLAVPAEFDAAILRSARAELARGQRRREFRSRLLRWGGAGAAAAATVAAAVVLLVEWQRRAPRPSMSSRPALAGDVDGNGRVDILDAFALARAIADKNRKEPLPSAWDVNHDGVVDEKDVRWVAEAAVRVAPASARVPNDPSELTNLADQLRAGPPARGARSWWARAALVEAGGSKGAQSR